MVEVKGSKGDETNCDSCSIKADIIQYCVDNEIGPFNKFSLKNIYHDRTVNLSAGLSFLQIIVVVAFAIVTLSFSHAIYQYWQTFIIFVAAILTVSAITHYILARPNKVIRRKDVRGAFYLGYRCISDEHEPVLLSGADTLSHMYKGSSHNIEQVKFNIYTITHLRSSFNYFFFIFIPTWVLLPVDLLISNKLLSLILGVDLIATSISLILLYFIPNRKKDINLIKFETLNIVRNFYLMLISLHTVSSYTFRKFTSNLEVSKLCYVPFESDRKGRIYIIESISDSFMRGVKGIKFIKDNEEIKLEEIPKLITKRSLAKWQDAFIKSLDESDNDY